MIRITAKLLAVLASSAMLAALCFTGCGAPHAMDDVVKAAKEESANWQKKCDAANEKAEAYRTESEDWRAQFDDLGKKMVEASDDLDPAVIKELFRKHQKIDGLNKELQAKLDTARTAAPALLLSGSQLRLDILSFKGSAVLAIYVDEREFPLYRKQLQLQKPKPSLGITFNIAETIYQESVKSADISHSAKIRDALDHLTPANIYKLPHLQEPQSREGDIGTAFVSNRARIDNGYERKVDEAFKRFLDHEQFSRPNEPNQFYLDWVLFGAGEHKIRLAAERASPDFDVVVALKVIGNDGKELTIGSLELNSTTTPDLSKAKPLVIWLKYKGEGR
jgi:hypothetical protein